MLAFNFKTVFTCLCLAGGILASPLPTKRFTPSGGFSPRQDDVISLSGWHDIQSLGNFDDFYGKDNFGGGNNEIIVIQEEIIVCQSLDARIIRQQLRILQELAKQIISTQICEVEVQTIVLVEFNNDMDNYKKDVKRESGKDVSYDKEIAGKYKDIKKDDGSLNQEDLGFSGSDVGKNNVTPQGNNWDDASGPQKVGEAEDAAGKALNKEPEA